MDGVDQLEHGWSGGDFHRIHRLALRQLPWWGGGDFHRIRQLFTPANRSPMVEWWIHFTDWQLHLATSPLLYVFLFFQC